jgi:hypothetical protein
LLLDHLLLLLNHTLLLQHLLLLLVDHMQLLLNLLLLGQVPEQRRSDHLRWPCVKWCAYWDV